MKQSLVRRKKISQGINVEPPASSPTSHPGYAPDAALHAIKRHALDFVNPKELQVSNLLHKRVGDGTNQNQLALKRYKNRQELSEKLSFQRNKNSF